MKKCFVILLTICLCLVCIACNSENKIVTKEVVFYHGTNGLYSESSVPELPPLSWTRNAGTLGCWSDIFLENEEQDDTLYAFEVGLRKNHLENTDKKEEGINKVKQGFLEEGFYIMEGHNYISESNDFVIVGTIENFVRVFASGEVETIEGWSCWAKPASRPDWNEVKDSKTNITGQSIVLEVELIAP